MAGKRFSLAVFIGRFQPFHCGHAHIIRNALENADHVLIMIGSANRPRSTYQPFSLSDRFHMVRTALSHEFGSSNDHRLTLMPLDDHPYNLNRWLEGVQRQVRAFELDSGEEVDETRISLTGFQKDKTTFYLDKFPQWDFADYGMHDFKISATNIRDSYFLTGAAGLDQWCTPGVISYLANFQDRPEYQILNHEYLAEIEYRRKYGNGPFQTADAIVIRSGHVLLVKRGGKYGHGMLALPGGFVNHDETLEAGSLRELFEETKIFDGLSELGRNTLLWNGYRGRRRFDDPKRSQRARLITEAFLYKLPDNDGPLPEVVGSDDAQEALWVPLGKLKPTEMFEDHFWVIEKMMEKYL